MNKGAQKQNLKNIQTKDEEMKTEEAVEKQEKAKENKKKTEKKQKKRINLDENNLLYGQNGLRKFYEIIMKTDFNSSKQVIIIQLTIFQ